MADGSWRKISELRVGDRVLSVPHGSVNEAATACEVTAIESGVAPAWQLTFFNSVGETLQFTASEGHPFYVDGRGWVDVKELKVGDIIVTQNGSTFTLSSKTFVEQVVTWSLTVAEKHTFFVGDGLGNEVVVHNACELCNGTGTIPTNTKWPVVDTVVYLKCICKHDNVLWRGNWTKEEMTRVRNALEIIRKNIPNLIEDANAVKDKVNSEDYKIIKADLTSYINVLNNIKGFINGEGEIVFRQEEFDADSDADGRYWWGAVYLNTASKYEWKEKIPEQLAVLIFHELSHHWGTHDGDGKNPMMNAHMLDDHIIIATPDIVHSMMFQASFGTKYPKYLRLPCID